MRNVVIYCGCDVIMSTRCEICEVSVNSSHQLQVNFGLKGNLPSSPWFDFSILIVWSAGKCCSDGRIYANKYKILLICSD
jgi:hypothetical protein